MHGARKPSPLVISEFRVGHLNLRLAQLWIHFNVLIKLFRVIINDTSKNPSLRSGKINDFKSLLTILIIICFEFNKNIEQITI